MANKIYEVIEMKKKILLVVVGIISGLLFSCKDVKALSDDSYLETNYTGVWAYHYKNGNLVTYGGLPFRYLNGKMGYCIEPSKPITVHTYSSYSDWSKSGFSEDVKRKMELIAYYGYEYPGHNNLKYYMATQELIWLFSEDTVVWKQNRDFSSETLNVEGEKNEIMTLVNNHNKLPSFINSSYTSEFGKELTLVDYNNVLSNYDINGDIAYTVNGNTININTNKFGKGTIYFNQKNFNDKETTVYVADRYNSQKIVVFGHPSLNSGNINISVDNAKIEFSKKDIETKELIKDKNAKYKLINNETKEVKEIVIDKTGISNITIPKGVYTLEEIKAPFGYSLNKEKTTITLNDDIKLSDGVFKVDLYDKKTKGKIKIKKVSEDGNDLVGVVIGIYDSNKNLIEKIKTDEKNNNESKILPLGKYYVKEISTLTGYKLDSNFYEANLNYNNQNEEVVIGNIKLVNEKIRCDLVYITSDKDGNFLENVEINVVDKDGNLVFNGKTDTQGRVIINDLPYGEYYIRQIKVPSGFILNNDEYKFYVNDSTCNSSINVINEKTVMPVTSKQNSMYLVSFIILFGIGVYNYVKKDS